jgi:hypothetical protein
MQETKKSVMVVHSSVTLDFENTIHEVDIYQKII